MRELQLGYIPLALFLRTPGVQPECSLGFKPLLTAADDAGAVPRPTWVPELPGPAAATPAKPPAKPLQQGNTSAFSDESPGFNASLLQAVSAVEHSGVLQGDAPVVTDPITPMACVKHTHRRASTPFAMIGTSPIKPDPELESKDMAPAVKVAPQRAQALLEALMSQAADLRGSMFSHPKWLPGQEQAVSAALLHKDIVLSIAPGGGGMLPVFVASLVQSGVTVVVGVDELRMQVYAHDLRHRGVRARVLASGESPEEVKSIKSGLCPSGEAAASCQLALLFVSAHKVMRGRWLQSALAKLALAGQLQRFVILDAQRGSPLCPSFRRDVRSLSALRQVFPGVPVTCCTTNSQPALHRDVVSIMAMTSPEIVCAPCTLHKATLRVAARRGLARMAAEVAKLHCRATECLPGQAIRGVVFCKSGKEAERLKAELVKCAPSHVPALLALPDAGIKQLGTLQEWASAGSSIILTVSGTSLPLSRAQVQFAVHTSVPRFPDTLLRDVGRVHAGGGHVLHVLLHNPGDLPEVESESGGTVPLGLSADEAAAYRELMMQHQRSLRGALQTMRTFAEDDSLCRKQYLLQAYCDESPALPGPPELCCDTCAHQVACEGSEQGTVAQRAGVRQLQELSVGPACIAAMQALRESQSPPTLVQLAEVLSGQTEVALTKSQARACIALMARCGRLRLLAAGGVTGVAASPRVFLAEEVKQADSEASEPSTLPATMAWRRRAPLKPYSWGVEQPEARPAAPADAPCDAAATVASAPVAAPWAVSLTRLVNGQPALPAAGTSSERCEAATQQVLTSSKHANGAASTASAVAAKQNTRARVKAQERRAAQKLLQAQKARMKNGSSILSFFSAVE